MSVIKNNENLYVLDDKNASSAKRKMAAIFAADVVGYSKLMAANEKLTLFRLKETRKLTDKIINNLHGRIFSTAGDSIMAEFCCYLILCCCYLFFYCCYLFFCFLKPAGLLLFLI